MDKSYGRVKHIATNEAQMAKNDPERERRLAEALRANLRKRKTPKEGDDASTADAPATQETLK